MRQAQFGCACGEGMNILARDAHLQSTGRADTFRRATTHADQPAKGVHRSQAR